MKAWFKWITEGYPGGKLKGWKSKGWTNGLGFCAMIAGIFPDKLNYNEMKEHHTPQERLEAAFTIAEEELGVEQILDPKLDIVDMGDAPIDQMSLILYLTYLQPAIDKKMYEQAMHAATAILGPDTVVTPTAKKVEVTTKPPKIPPAEPKKKKKKTTTTTTTAKKTGIEKQTTPVMLASKVLNENKTPKKQKHSANYEAKVMWTGSIHVEHDGKGTWTEMIIEVTTLGIYEFKDKSAQKSHNMSGT